MIRALDDIRASIQELKFYRDNIFLPLEPVTDGRTSTSQQENIGHKTAL